MSWLVAMCSITVGIANISILNKPHIYVEKTAPHHQVAIKEASKYFARLLTYLIGNYEKRHRNYSRFRTKYAQEKMLSYIGLLNCFSFLKRVL